jgi:hypothetical protein
MLLPIGHHKEKQAKFFFQYKVLSGQSTRKLSCGMFGNICTT